LLIPDLFGSLIRIHSDFKVAATLWFAAIKAVEQAARVFIAMGPATAYWSVLARTWNERPLLEFPTLVGPYFATALLQNSLKGRPADDNPGLQYR
jgi:hypothetical protein